MLRLIQAFRGAVVSAGFCGTDDDRCCSSEHFGGEDEQPGHSSAADHIDHHG